MDYQKLTNYRNHHNPFAEKLGIVIQEITLGYARVVMPIGGEELNPLGYAHGGCYFSLADVACGAAAASRGHRAVTVDANYHFLRSAAQGDQLIAEAREVKDGQNICVYDVRIADQTGALLGTGSFTFFRLDGPVDGWDEVQ